MVKTPRTRHSKPQRQPVTIDLEPGDVSRVAETPAPDVEATSFHQQAEAEAAVAEAESVRSYETAAQSGATVSAQDDAMAGTSERDQPSTAHPAAKSDEAEKPANTWQETRGASETAAVKPPAKRSSLSLVAAGLIGGLLALGGGYGLQYAGLLGTPGSGGAAPGLDALQAELTALKGEVAALGDRGPDAALSGRVDGVTQTLEQVKADVASLQQAIQSGAGGEAAGLQALDAKVKEIEAAVAALGQNSGAPDAGDITALGERIAAVEALAKAAGEAGAAVDGRIGALEQSVTALAAKVDAQAAQPKIALAIAAAALKSAVDRGEAFQSEVETFAAIAPDTPELDALRAHAEKGVATVPDLVADVDDAANAMIAAANPPDANAGFFDRLLASAESLVAVRPIGDVPGEGVPETVARMELAVKSGDLAKALAEYETLPETAKSAGAGFADRLRARLDVERLVEQAIAAAMKA